MATARQRKASRENLKKARRVWQRMSPRARARSQPQGRRAKPGSTGRGAFFHIEVRPRSEFETFRTQDVGKSGGIERVAGKRSSGSWATQKWLIGKEHAHVTAGGKLVADSRDAHKVLDALGATPKHVGGNRFRARARPNVPERRKPTPAQRRARRGNVRKAKATRRKA